MRIEYTGRNIDITPALKAHVEEKIDHAARALDDVVGAHVVLAVEKYRHIAEVIVQRRRGRLTGKASSRDMYESVQAALHKIETQVRRKRDKVIGRKRRGTAAKAAAGDALLTMDEAPPEPRGIRIIEEAPDRVKPIAVEEAVLLFESASRPFVVFRDSSTGQVGVLYRRRDGHFGLVAAKS